MDASSAVAVQTITLTASSWLQRSQVLHLIANHRVAKSAIDANLNPEPLAVFIGENNCGF
jgi:hypothetical protein